MEDLAALGDDIFNFEHKFKKVNEKYACVKASFMNAFDILIKKPDTQKFVRARRVSWEPYLQSILNDKNRPAEVKMANANFTKVAWDCAMEYLKSVWNIEATKISDQDGTPPDSKAILEAFLALDNSNKPLLVTFAGETIDHCVCIKKTKNQFGNLSAQIFVYDNNYDCEVEFENYFSNKKLCIKQAYTLISRSSLKK